MDYKRKRRPIPSPPTMIEVRVTSQISYCHSRVPNISRHIPTPLDSRRTPRTEFLSWLVRFLGFFQHHMQPEKADSSGSAGGRKG